MTWKMTFETTNHIYDIVGFENDTENPNSERKMLIDKIVYVDGWPAINDGTPSVKPISSPKIK